MRTFLYRYVRPVLHFIVVLAIIGVCLLARKWVRRAKAAEYLHFGNLPQREITISFTSGYWQLPGGNAHQNKVLRLYQEALQARGVTDSEALHYGAAVLVSENEPLTLDRLGDHGHAYGICQKSVKPQYAVDYLKKHPEEGSVQAEVGYCADRFAQAWARFKTLTSLHRIVTPDKTILLIPENVFRTAVENNCPACARAGVDSTRANHKPLIPSYFNRVNIAAGKLSLL